MDALPAVRDHPAAQPAPPAPPPGAKTGVAANAAAGAVEGGASLGNILTDPFGNLIGKPLTAAAMAGYHALAPMFGWKDMTPEDRAFFMGDQAPQPGTRVAEAVGQAMGAPSLDQVQPANTSEQLARAATAGAVGLAPFVPGGIAGKALGAAAGAVGGAGGQVAENAVPEPYKPLASMVGGTVTGAVPFVGAAAARGATQAAGAAGRLVTGPRTADQVMNLAARRAQEAVAEPAATAAALDQGATSAVPGFAPTALQASGGDAGLATLEATQAAKGRTPFKDRANQQTAALNEHLAAQVPEDASGEAPAARFRTLLTQLDAQNEARESAAIAAAQAETSRLGGPVPVGADAQETALQGYGNALRAPLVEAKAAAKAAEKRLWDAIDPDGTLAVDMSPARDAARATMKGMPANAAPMAGEEGAIFARAALLPKVQPFLELRALRRRITDAMRVELRTNGETETYGRLSSLLDAVHATMDPAVQEAAARDAGLAGRLNEASVAARSGADSGQIRAGAVAGSGGAQPGVPGESMPAAAATPRAAGRNSGLASQAADVNAAHSVLASNATKLSPRDYVLAGGSGQRSAIIMPDGSLHEFAPSYLTGSNGLGAHDRFATETGFLNTVKITGYGREIGIGIPADSTPQQRATARALAAAAKREGGSASVFGKINEPDAPQRNAVNGLGLPAGATQADNGLEGRPNLTPNWSAESTARYSAAREATRTRHETFTRAPGVGEAIAPGPTADSFKLASSKVPSAMLGGKGQAERVQAYLKANGNRQALLDYAAFDLRRTAERQDGTLDPTKARNWLSRNAEAATVLPELRSMAEPAIQASEQVPIATAQRIAERTAFERSAAGRFIGEVPPERAIARVLDDDTREAGMRQLAKLTAGDKAARAGLEKLAVDHMIEIAKSNALAGSTGAQMIKSDVFQNRLRKYDAALKAILSPQQMAALHNVAAELQRVNLSITETKMAGRSNTAADTLEAAKHGHEHPSVVGVLMAAEIAGDVIAHGVGVFAHAGDPIGSAVALLGKVGGALGTLFLAKMREEGYAKVENLLTEATLNPALMKTLMIRPTAKSGPGVLALLGQQLRALALTSTATSSRDEPAPSSRKGY